MLKFVEKIVQELERDGRFAQERLYVQHGDTSVYAHSISVAETSLRLARKYRIKVNKYALVRAALLHDYFLYDWHVHEKGRAFHPTGHPEAARKNAVEDYGVSELEQNIIASHMFPLGHRMPHSKEAWIVTLADKICASREIAAPRARKVNARSFRFQDLIFRFLGQAF